MYLYLHFLDCVFFEYCSVECISDFINFVKNYIQSHNDKQQASFLFIECLGRRCLNLSNAKILKLLKRHEKIIEVSYDHDNPKKGILNHEYLRENIKIEENERHEAEKIVENFVKEFIEKLQNEELTYEVKSKDEYIEVILNGKNISYLIGYRGETLNAIQTILNSVLKNKMKTALRVTLDICGYKEERKKTLEDLAVRVANSVIKTGKSVTLDPMRPYERKIIHSKLQENSKIRTHSVGEEPYRKIVISLKK